MAVDSIIASPTNNVRVMVAEASGCWASEVSAVATALPSAKAGPIQPKPVVMPAMTIDATAIIVMLSIVSPLVVLCSCWNGLHGFRLGLTDSRSGRDIHRRQDAEDIGLHHAGEQAQHRHNDREDEGRDGEQDADNHRSAHHVAEQTDGQGERTRKFADD